MGVLRVAKVIDLEGQRFGKLVIGKWCGYRTMGNGKRLSTYEYKCDCGKTGITTIGRIRGGVKSCGCLMIEGAREANTKHGLRYTRIYHIWASIFKRAGKHKNYKDVTVCDEWKVFENFYRWAMDNGYDDTLTIDRIDPYGNYEPSNCRWATPKEQANNRRNTRHFTINGETHTLTELADIYGVPAQLVRDRLKKGKSIEKALTAYKSTGYHKRIRIVETGEEFVSMSECARHLGIKYHGISNCVRGKSETSHGLHFELVEE